MVIKAIDLIRKFKKDNSDKQLDWAALEMEANQFDGIQELEMAKLDIKKQKSDLENEKLKIEIERLKNDKIFVTSDGNGFKISDITTILKNSENQFLVGIKGAKHFVYLNKEEHDELRNKINE